MEAACFYMNATTPNLEKENINSPKSTSSLIRVVLPPSLITKEVKKDPETISRSVQAEGGVNSKEQVHRPPRWGSRGNAWALGARFKGETGK